MGLSLFFYILTGYTFGGFFVPFPVAKNFSNTLLLEAIAAQLFLN
jgi:hypothetical protein